MTLFVLRAQLEKPPVSQDEDGVPHEDKEDDDEGIVVVPRPLSDAAVSHQPMAEEDSDMQDIMGEHFPEDHRQQGTHTNNNSALALSWG